MAATIPSAALVPVTPVFTNTERLALAGFLAGYSGLTRQAYELDLRLYAAWCQQHQLRLFAARRADIECFARELETRGRARATITRRLSAIAGFYRYPVEEELLDHSPAAHVRRARLDYESHATGLDRDELGALLVAAGLGPARRARAHLPASAERAARVGGHRRQHPGPGCRARAPDVGGHSQGQQSRDDPARASHDQSDRPGGRRAHSRADLPDRRWRSAGPARRRADRAPRCPPGGVSPSLSGRTRCDTPPSPRPLTPGSRCGTCKKPPRTLIHAPPCATTALGHP
jgi:Phage integrase, N-terminal SAM-like domain